MRLTAARRFARSRAMRAGTLPVLVSAAAVTVMYVLLQSLTLSGSRLADRDLGRYDAYAGFGVAEFGPGSDVRSRVAAAVAAVGGARMDVSLVVNGMWIPELGDGSLTYTEMRWEAEPFPGRYRLRSGRWPARPGEIAVVDSADDTRDRVPRLISAYGARARFTVVGSVHDLYSAQPAVLGAPGTWAALDPRLRAASPVLRAQPVVYWSGERPRRVIAAIAAAYHDLLPHRDPARLRRRLWPTYADRRQVEARRERSWIAESPAGYTVPSLLLPLLSVLAAFGVSLRRLRRALAVMTSVGVPRRAAVAAVGVALTGACLVAAVLGALIGLALGIPAARVLAALAGGPSPAIPSIAPPLLRLLLTTSFGAALAWTMLAERSPIMLRATPGPRRWERSRRLAGCAALVVAGLQAPRLDSAPRAMAVFAIAAIAVLLLLPDAVTAGLCRLPEGSLRARLAKRQLLADGRRATALVGLLALLIGLSTGFLALLDTMIRTAGAQGYPDVLPGQVQIASRGTDLADPPPRAVAAARSVPPLRSQAPVRMRFLAQLDRSGDVRRQVEAGDDDGLLLAADTPADVERLAGHELSAAQVAVLRRGGLLRWGSASTAPTVAVHVAGAREEPLRLPVARLALERAAWNVGTAGITLSSTARRHRLPLVSGALMYTGVPPHAAAAVRAALERAGTDPLAARIHRAPPPPIPPLALYVTALGLVLVTLLVTLALTRTQVRGLRDHLGQLVALGLGPRWVRLVVVRQHLVLVTMATAVGLVMGVPIAVLAGWRIPGFVVSVPWGQLAVLVAAIFAAVLLATALATRRIRARDRWSA